jgi:hypothetical protein
MLLRTDTSLLEVMILGAASNKNSDSVPRPKIRRADRHTSVVGFTPCAAEIIRYIPFSHHNIGLCCNAMEVESSRFTDPRTLRRR